MSSEPGSAGFQSSTRDERTLTT
uniref:Uncharacterized protein n=1 Tax=Rhizophora mucronata TaxID=61149 RepID=A0A2P2N404_RHIMU